MITTKVQRDRLHILLDEVFPIMLVKGENVMLHYYSYLWGRPMCIAGEACVLPRFNVMGLTMRPTYNWPEFSGDVGSYALEKFFGMGSYEQLFKGNLNPHSDLQEVKLRQAWLKGYLNDHK